ncbi:MAG: hypothetical protein G3H99_03045 [Ferrovum sp.]|nr:hypothetical protein [Ferrovum sp.]NDU86890.1 hypothetical protein [Ferrovum sp.]
MSIIVPQEKDSGKWVRGFFGLSVATVINHFGDRLLGVTIEVFTGPFSYFTFSWMLDVFLVPFIANFVLALIFGKGSKWLCYVTPLIVRGISYFNIAEISGVPQGGHLIPMGWWGFFIILAMETGMIGAIIGESMIKRYYGRAPSWLKPDGRARIDRSRAEQSKEGEGGA